MKIKISSDLEIPLEVVTQKLGWIGVTGSGKTYGAMKTAELLWAAKAQFVVVDPVGVWWGLRLDKDGKTAGIPIPVFGGLHGDVPLEATGGELLANLIVDRGISAVLDVSQFESDAQKARFASDFARVFFFRKKSAPSAVHIFLEECQEFVPQNPMRGEEQMLHHFHRLQKLGRNFGIGTSLITQRPQEVNKKALNQAQTLFVFRLTGSQERKAIEAWITDKGMADDVLEDLPKMKTGDCHLWSPAWLQEFRTMRFLPKHTYDASSTPEVGARAVARELAPIDLEKIRRDMAATIEKAKAEDPKALRAEVAALKAKLAKPIISVKSPICSQPKRIEVPVLKETQIKRIEITLCGVEKASGRLLEAFKALGSALAKAQSHEKRPERPITATIPRFQPTSRFTTAQFTAREKVGSSQYPVSHRDLGRGERLVLTAIFQNQPASRDQINILTGYKRSTRDAYLQRLVVAGLVMEDGGLFRTLPEAQSVLGDVQPLPTGEDLREHWLQKLPRGEEFIFREVLRAYPETIDRDRLTEATGFKRSTRDAYLQRLIARRIVTDVGRGQIKASDLLYT